MTRRERLERKLELRHEWAAKAEARSNQHYSTGHKMLDAIPFGQPILIGHHSEKRDRAYRGRAIGHMDKFVAERKLSEHHESCASGIESALDSSIFSDDDNAIAALEARIAEREAEREKMVLVNKLWRKKDAAGLAALFIDLEALTKKLAEAGPYWGKQPHMPYELSNLGGRITADRKRLEYIKQQAQRSQKAEQAPNGVTLEQCSGGYVRVTFAEKPDREILNDLRAAGFHWGAGSWSGKDEALPASVRGLLEDKPQTAA